MISLATRIDQLLIGVGQAALERQFEREYGTVSEAEVLAAIRKPENTDTAGMATDLEIATALAMVPSPFLIRLLNRLSRAERLIDKR